MQLHGDHPGSGSNERRGQRSGTGAEIDDEIVVPDPGPINDVASRALIESMKSPAQPRGLRPWSCPGHDAP